MRSLKVVLLLAIALPSLLHAQPSPVISSFSENGLLIATNLHPGSVATVEWAPSLNGPWSTNWAGLDAVTVDSNGVIQVSVPMFYRVRGIVASTNTVGIETSVPSINVAESGSNTFGVRLTAQPPADVTVTVASGNTNKATASPPTLTFTTFNWNTLQTVTVNGVNDDNATNENAVIFLSTTATTNQVAVAIADNDELRIEASVLSLSVIEGSTANFSVRLTAQPPANVTVTVNSGNTGQATAGPSTLTFTTANWNIYQTVTVSGTQDPDAADATVTITAAASGLTSATVGVSVTDNDTLGIETSVSSLTVIEGSFQSFGLRLTAQPPASVTVNIVSDNPAKASVQSSKTFTVANWNTYQNVSVTGVQDADDLDEEATITLSAPTMSNKSVSVTVTDDDILDP